MAMETVFLGHKYATQKITVVMAVMKLDVVGFDSTYKLKLKPCAKPDSRK